jgi:hypothetical protein
VNVQSPPGAVQLQYFASTQNPPDEFEKRWQQPVKQSALAVHDGRHPTKSGFGVLETHVPVQHRRLSLHVPPWGVHGFAQADGGAHSRSPVPFKSVQHAALPPPQSAFVAQLR